MKSMIAIKAMAYNITSSINTNDKAFNVQFQSLNYHNALNITNMLINVMLLHHYTKGVTSA